MKISRIGIVFIIIVGCYLFLFLDQRIYPFVDLPNHLAEATIYKFSDTAIFDQIYTVSKGVEPNSFHYIFCSLFSDVERGNAIYYFIYALLFVSTIFLIIRKLGGNWEFSFLSLLLVFNYNVTFGFVGFSLAIPIVLFVFYLLCFDSLWAKGLALILLILLFFVHVLGLLFCLLLIGLFTIVKAKDIKTFLNYIWCGIPSFILLVLWYKQAHAFTDQSTFSFLMDYYRLNYLPELYLRYKVLMYDNHTLAGGYLGGLIALLFSTAMVLPILLKTIGERISWTGASHFIRENINIGILLLASILCCFLLPQALPGQSFLYQRYSVFLFISLVILGSLLNRNPLTNNLRIVLVLIASVHLVSWYDYLKDFDKENDAFDSSLFEEVPKDRILGGVIIDYKYRGRPVYIHFPNYHIIWNKGLATTKLIDYRFGSIRRKVSSEVLPEYQEWAGDGELIPKEYHGLEYLLLKGEPKNLSPNRKILSTSKDWSLVFLN